LEKGEKKIFGAGILSSFDEVKYALSDKPKFYPLDLFEVSANHHSYPITSVQPYYFVAESFSK
jgi:phenylalanine-4-hydroxylase